MLYDIKWELLKSIYLSSDGTSLSLGYVDINWYVNLSPDNTGRNITEVSSCTPALPQYYVKTKLSLVFFKNPKMHLNCTYIFAL